MKDLKSLKVGQTYFLVEADERHRKGNGQVVVTKVGKKFFYVNKEDSSEAHERKFEIEQWRNAFAKEVINFGGAARLFESEEIYAFDKKWDSLVFNFEHKATKLTKDQKEKIIKIMEEIK